MHLVYVRPGLVDPLNGTSGYDKWDRERDRGGGPAAPAQPAWPARDRERDRERERQARAHQMSHANASDTDAASLFPAPIRVNNRDRVSQQIQTKLGDYRLAQTLLDDPSKSIGICAEPASPAPCPPRRESEFKKPAHAPQNGRVHHRPYSYNKNEGPNSTGAPAHRPPPLRINGYQIPNVIDSSQPPIESILKEMKSLPNPISSIAATPRKETDNKFIFNPYTNKVQENPLQEKLTNNDLKAPLPKPGLDNRLPNSRSSVSPEVVKVDLGLSESDDEVPATTTRLEPILSPIGSASPGSSVSESSPSDSDSDSSSAESTVAPPAKSPPQPQPQQERPSWELKNFAPLPAHQPTNEHNFASATELRTALIDAQGKPSPISELSESEVSSPSGGRRRRSLAHRASTASSDDEDVPRLERSPRAPPTGVKRGRPPKPRPVDERPAKKKRGRPRKTRVPSPPPAPPAALAPSEPEELLEPPAQDTKTHIFRKVFTPRKTDDGCGGKGGKGGKGKGGKGKGQVTIIEAASVTPQMHYDRERAKEAMARVSPPQEPETVTRKREAERMAIERIQERVSLERSDLRRPDERMPERTSNERLPPDRDRISDRSMSDRSAERLSISDRRSTERFSSDRSMDRSTDRMDRSTERIDRSTERIDRSTERIDRSTERLDRSMERLDRSTERIDRSTERLDRSTERIVDIKTEVKPERLSTEKSHDRLSEVKTERICTERFVRAEADVGSGLKLGRGSERLEEASSIAACTERRRGRVLVRISLQRLRPDTVRSLRRTPAPAKIPPPPQQASEVAATNHERSSQPGPVYYSYFERLPADVSIEDRNSDYHITEAKRLRTAADEEKEPLMQVMLYLESVLCFVLTGRVYELEMNTKRAFTIYRETIEYIKIIHSMPTRFRASPQNNSHYGAFSKLDILSMRVQSLLYLRMFRMYDREVKEYKKIVQDYQQKVNPALAESASPLSPSPSPCSSGSAGSAASGSASTSSGYCSLAHAVPAHAHNALLQLTRYYTFLYVAHDLWEQADNLCRLKTNQDLFIAVDRKCGPLSLSSTFRHLVEYVRYAISVLKNAPRE